MTFPLIRQHDAAQVGVSAETHAEEVPDLALVEIGRWPFRSDAGYFRIQAIDQDAEPDTFLETVRKNVVGDLKAGLAGVPVHAGHIRQEVVTRLLQCAADGPDVVALDPESQFAAIEAS